MNLANLTIWTQPYPLLLARGIFPQDKYNWMVENFPRQELMVHMGGAYEKYSLSERNNPQGYLKFLESRPAWQEFHKYVKGGGLVRDVLHVLSFPDLEIGLLPQGLLTARFEFSSLPAIGGRLDPHTDIPTKVVTLVLPMTDGSWDQSWGGGTDILVPKYPGKTYQDYKNPLSDFDKVRTVEFQPNQALIFLKTKNSWHSVAPITGPAGILRNSLTVNIELPRRTS